MPNLFRLLLVLLACASPVNALRAADAPSVAPPFQENKDYVQLPTSVPTSVPGKSEVVEFFSYRCPHCYQLDASVEEWLKRKPDGVGFLRIAVANGFQPDYDSAARAYYAAEALGVLDKIHQPLFKAIHQEKRSLNTVDELAAFFAEHGVDQDAFRKAYASFQIETHLRRGDQLAQRYRVRGVPAIFVNGQYEVRSPRLFEVVDFLLAR
ncbi:MAG TPA: thiol:disulfide interchange protein DsbA/DsbL [Candidatus Competibacter sp.]|nr:thiol:disulfide interchange protein DsbA/DsbL [Candidatus Competibacter sp.]HUM95241.1 thiol:disulfide interchange protein DsbA/DsbL [Candidatus Competibacter sp.]